MLTTHNFKNTSKMVIATIEANREECAGDDHFDLDAVFESLLESSEHVTLTEAERASLNAKGMSDMHFKRGDRMERLFVEGLNSVGEL